MEYLKINQIIEANKSNLSVLIQKALIDLDQAQRTYPGLVLDIISSGNLSRQLALAQQEAAGNSRIDNAYPFARASGAYFFNEEIIGGTREKEVLNYVNRSAKSVAGWKTQQMKLKLGPGIGLIEAPSVYRELIELGMRDPSLTVNYSAPFGTSEARKGIKTIMDSRIDPEKSFFPEEGLFITEGATEGIDLFMQALATLEPNSRVIMLGLSYYTGPYSAIQKNLQVERLITDPIQVNESTRFFPTGEEIEKSLPTDSKALIVTIPNNPNGETYSEKELIQILNLAKKRKIYILFDAIFENMYFDQEENYRSNLLQLATKLGALDRVVVVDSVSKTKNFPGKRLGFLATTNREFSNTLTDIVLSRRCNPPLTVGPLLSFEGLARKTKSLLQNSRITSIDRIVDFVFGADTYSFSKDKFKKMFAQWNEWDKEVLKYYEGNLQLTKTLLDRNSTGWSPDEAAFNTLVRTQLPNSNSNSMDFLSKFMFTLATYTQVGPCFGLSQRVWDKELGVWSRVSYACSREDLVEGIKRLIIFSKFYQEKNFGDPNKFPTLQINFDNQI